MYKRWMVAAVAAAIAVSSFGIAAAAGGGPQADLAADVALDETVDGVQRCDGFKHKRHLASMSDRPFRFNEADGQVLVASRTVDVPNGKDTLAVAFNAETRLYGSSDEGHWIQIDIYLNGKLMNPNDATSNLAIANDGEGWESNIVRACERVEEGTYLIEVKATANDHNNSANLRAWLDDWMLTIDRFG